MATLHSKDRSHDSRYTLKDVDCKEKGKYACAFNGDFMGFHFLNNINYDASIDITLETMTATTCMVYCKSTNEVSVVAILQGKRCICSKANPTTFAAPKFKVKNKISGKYMTAGAVDDHITEADATNDDTQEWTWTKDGQLESVKHPGNVLRAYRTNPNVKLVASDLSMETQKLVFDQGTLFAPKTSKVLNVNNGQLRGSTDESGADIWELEYIGTLRIDIFIIYLLPTSNSFRVFILEFFSIF